MALSDDILQAAQAIGWDVLYGEHFKPGELRAPNASGEMSARSPFPFSNDSHASFSVSQVEGLFVDFHAAPITGMKGGNFVQFIAMMYYITEHDGRFEFDWSAAERWVRVRLGLTNTVDALWLEKVQCALKVENSPIHEIYRGRKPWSTQTMIQLGLGYDDRTGRIVFPLYDSKGMLQNCRMYNPGGDVKMVWLNRGMSGNFLFPPNAAQESWVVLVEGEPDVVTLRSLGFNGCSGTMGSGNPLPGPTWWTDKIVYVLMDDDKPGRDAADSAVSQLIKGGAASVHLIASLPQWDGKPHNADISDWVTHLYRSGSNKEQVQIQVRKLLTEAPETKSPDAVWDAEPQDLKLFEVIRSENAGKRIRTTAKIIFNSSDTFRQGSEWRGTCPAQGQRGCANCAMNKRYKGAGILSIDPRSELGLNLYQHTNQEIDRVIRKQFQIDERCPKLDLKMTKHVDARQIILSQTLQDITERVGSNDQGLRVESIFLIRQGMNIATNQDYHVEGFIHPDPKTQKQLFIVDKWNKVNSSAEDFIMSQDIIKQLSKFQPGPMTVSSKIADRADDIAETVTFIRERQDLHLLYMAVWHGAIAFTFENRHYERGWIEAIVIGDSRTGKSSTFNYMEKFFNTGLLVDCKMQSKVGILGAIETSTTTGARYIVPGIMPQQDGAGPIAFDEFTSNEWKNSLIEILSSTREMGIVKIYKAVSAEFQARVGGIWMCNPGTGTLIGEMGNFGIQILPRIIDQPEDIARFTMAMIVTQNEIDKKIINTPIIPTDPRYPQDDCRLLISWIRSRTVDQIIFTTEAEKAVRQLANFMCEKYTEAILLVEPASQHFRVAKLAVSVAGQLFSCDETGEILVVKPEHVHAVWNMYEIWYNKESLGYDKYSVQVKENSVVLNPHEVQKMIDTTIKQGNHILFAEALLQMAAFSEKSFVMMAPMDYLGSRLLLQTLSINKCIRPDLSMSSRRDMWLKTPQFMEFLRRYIDYRSRMEQQL